MVNLYPFEATAAQGAPYAECVENIDIGGPAMIRAAAKNHASVTVVVDAEDYAAVLAEMAQGGGATSLALRQALAAKAYARTAAYDAAISGWFADALGERAPRRRAFAGRLAQELRYGENPHQRAAFYVTGERRPGVATAVQHQGKELSYNNLADTDAAFELVAEFDPKISPAVAIIKHANPCGVALGSSLAEAYAKALRCDPVSAFGGIIALNGPIDAATAREITGIFTEVVIAPDATPEAKAIFAQKKNLRLLTTGGLPDPRAQGLTLPLAFRRLPRAIARQRRGGRSRAEGRDQAAADAAGAGGPEVRLQDRQARQVERHRLRQGRRHGRHRRRPDEPRRQRPHRRLEIAGGGESRGLTEPLAKGSVVASDAFFPFADGLLAAAEAGATAVIQPGGSVRDDEVIKAADEKGLAMVFTGVRHFRH